MSIAPIHNKITAVKQQLKRIASLTPIKANASLSGASITDINFGCPSPLREKLCSCPRDIPRFDFAGQNFWVRLENLHDGDSPCVIFESDSTLYKMMTRLIGIDTPEIRTKDLAEKKLAVAARNRAAHWALPEHFQVDGVYTEKEVKRILAETPVLLWMKCSESDKFGRTLVKLFRNSEMTDCLNSLLLSEGYGDSYQGGKKQRTWDVAK